MYNVTNIVLWIHPNSFTLLLDPKLRGIGVSKKNRKTD
jgi:hypothetical protein